jgi:hypothetical protein
MDNKSGTRLRTTAIILMGATAAMNIVGGIGTVCAAFFTRDWPMLWDLYEYRWLYQILMFITIIIGVVGVWLTIRLNRGKKNTFRNSLLLLVMGTLFAGVQVLASELLRGKAVPTNFKLYANLVTLLFFLFISQPKYRALVGFNEEADAPSSDIAAGLAAIVSGIIVMTTTIWVGTSHIFDGRNWVEVLATPLSVSGTVLVLLGTGCLLKVIVTRIGSPLPKPGEAPISR